MSKVKIIIVDDHDVVRIGIRGILNNDPEFSVVGEATSGEEAVPLVRRLKPHVVLMDIKMPGIGGLSTTKKLLKVYPSVKILVLTVCNDDIFPSRLLQAGAVGYLVKGSNIKEISLAIRTVCEGQNYISMDIASRLAMKHLNGTYDSPFDELSERELEIALMITNGMGVQTISDRLCLSRKTVNSYRYRIFGKLKLKTDVALTHLAVRYNLIENIFC